MPSLQCCLLIKIWQTQPWTFTDIPINVFALWQSYWCSNIALGKDQIEMASHCEAFCKVFKWVKSGSDILAGCCKGEQSGRGVVPTFCPDPSNHIFTGSSVKLNGPFKPDSDVSQDRRLHYQIVTSLNMLFPLTGAPPSTRGLYWSRKNTEPILIFLAISYQD